MAVIDERDLSQERKWHYEQLANKCVKALNQNRIGAYYARDVDEARSIVMGLISEGVIVGMGDSVTLLQAGITQEIQKRGNDRVFNPFYVDSEGSLNMGDGRDFFNLMKQASSADVFLTSMSAITLDGKLVNTDGYGNRVAPLIFGPGNVIVVAGANKIVPSLDDALRRIKEKAAPLNAKRHNLKHGMGDPQPCVITGVCSDCRHPHRIYNFTVIVEGQMEISQRITVVLIAEELGL